MNVQIDSKWLLKVNKDGGYDVCNPSKVKQEDGTYIDSWVARWYNVPFERALTRVAHSNMAALDKNVDLRGFIELFRNEINRIKKLADGIG